MTGSNGGNSRLDRIEKLIHQSERANKEAHADHKREMREIRGELRAWTQLAVKEARNQRKRTQEIDENITRLAAAQLVTEEKLVRLETVLQQFLSSQQGRNGHS